MAIKPLDQRLDSMLPPAPTMSVEQAADLPPPIFAEDDQAPAPEEVPGDPSMEEKPLLAGPLQALGGALRSKIRSKSEAMVDAVKAKPDASPRPIVPGETPAGEIPSAVKVTPSTKVVPEAPQSTVDQVQQAVENRAALGPLEGKPPEEAFNLTNMQTDNIRAIIGGVGDALGIKTERVTFDEIRTKAADLGVDEKFLSGLIDNQGKMLPSAVDTYRAFQVLEKSADELGRLFGLVNSGQATEAQMLQLRQQISLHGLIQKAVKGVQTETARALAVMRIPRDGNIDVIRQVLDQTGGAESLQDLARAYISLPTTAARNQLIEKSMLSTVKDVWFTTWINGLLSSPVTHAKNMVGNTLFGAYQIPERLVAAFYSNVLPAGVRSWKALVPGSAKEKVEYDELLTEIQSFTSSVKRGLELASRAWRTEMPSDPLTKLELRRSGDQPDISAAAFGIEPDKWYGKAVDLYGKAITIPGRALMTEDEFFKGWYYQTAFDRLALRRSKSVYRDAIEGGADEATAAARAADEIEAIYKNPPKDLDEEAMNYARRGTFTMELPPMLKEVEKSFQNPIAKMVVPFFRTPANIGMEVLERTPFAPLVSSRFRNEFMQGGPARDLAIAKVTMGSALLATFASMSTEGLLTGRGPGRAADREALLRGGWQPYSLVLPRADFEGQITRLSSLGRVSIGDDKIYVSFNGMEPISAFLAMAADYAEYARYEEDAEKINEVFMGAAYGLFEYLGEQPWLTGVADVATSLFGPMPSADQGGAKRAEAVVNALTKQFTSFAIGGSPLGAYNSAVAAIERFMAPEASDTSVKGESLPMGVKGFYEGLKKYMARVPGLSANLPPKLNLWGDPILQGQGKAYEMVLPTRVSPGQFSMTDDILVQLGSPIGMPQRKVNGVELDANQYNRLLTIYGKELKVNGMDAKTAIYDMATSPGFNRQNLDDQQRLIRMVHDQYMEAARKTLVMEDPALQLKIQQMDMKKDAFGLFYKGE